MANPYDLRVLNETDDWSLTHNRMPLLGNAPGPRPAREQWEWCVGGLWWWAFNWTYDYAPRVHRAWWRRILGRPPLPPVTPRPARSSRVSAILKTFEVEEIVSVLASRNHAETRR